MLKGKIAYMPPEVLAGTPLDQRVDIWSLAASMYEMITGRRVYEGTTEQELAYGAPAPRIPLAHKVASDVDVKLSAVLARALHPKVRKRHQDAVELYRDLKAYMISESIHVDADALGKFVRVATGVSPTLPAPRNAPITQSFNTPGYESPKGMSLTQRIEVARRRKMWLPVAIAVLVALALYAGWTLGQRGSRPQQQIHEAPQ
jgi:serine/threonine-protein kinase